MQTTDDALQKFKQLLREFFQFDSADLDFGIYRIINHKRDLINDFLDNQLPRIVTKAFEESQLAEYAARASQLQGVRDQVIEHLGTDALDQHGNLREQWKDTAIGKKYTTLKKVSPGEINQNQVQESIFNHLYTFFNRYYDSGDFMSRRRYSKRERYAIPYNGEEVYLHWANKDQYYVKSTEHFRDYSFVSSGVRIRFRLCEISVEQSPNDNDKRYFLPVLDKVRWDEHLHEIEIPFQYRPLTSPESIKFGRRNQQLKIINQIIEEMPDRLQSAGQALKAINAKHVPTNGVELVSSLQHHLIRYTRKITSDFFIHKNLRQFLSGELDYYLKNEVLNIDSVLAQGASAAEASLEILRIIRLVGTKIIDLLSQIEAFQKLLWEKRKFIIDTDYLIAVSEIDEEFYPTITECDDQWIDWSATQCLGEDDLTILDGSSDAPQVRINLLKSHPTLLLDTRHYQRDFVDRILHTVDNLDDKTDGLLIQSENYQALMLLQERYRGRIGCVHIDPPYNTNTTGFLYKNSYRHSTWLTMMENSSSLATSLLTDDGAFICHIDENEYERLYLLLDGLSISNGDTIIWDKRNPMTGGGGIAIQHEYIIWRSNSAASVNLRNENIRLILDKASDLIDEHGTVNEFVRKHFAEWMRDNSNLTGGEKSYRYIDESGQVYTSVSLRAPEPRTDPKFRKPLLHPVSGEPCPVPPNGFSRTPETLARMMKRDEILFGCDSSTQPRQKRFLRQDSKRQLSSVIQDARRGKSDLKALGLHDFPYCHSAEFYGQLLGAATERSGTVVLDYFAGSGTTGHAIIQLNRQDNLGRKFILVEKGHHFETVLLPRIKKVSFAPAWTNGRPEIEPFGSDPSSNPRIVKYIRLESYEDALNNITFGDTTSQELLEFDDYLLEYMLDWETRESETFLNIQKLANPFDYTIRVRDTDDNAQGCVDIPETFNYLIGIYVKSRRVYYDDDRRYLVFSGSIEHRQVAIIWRKTVGWEKHDFDRDKAFILRMRLTDGMDDVLVNSDSFVSTAKSLDATFKARMFGSRET